LIKYGRNVIRTLIPIMKRKNKKGKIKNNVEENTSG